MRKIILVVFIFLLGSAAAYAKDLKLAFVDGQMILQKHRAEIDSRLDKEFGARKNSIVSLQQEIKAGAEKLQRDEAVLSEATAKKTQRELELKQRELQRLSQAYQEDFNLRGNQELQSLGERIQTIIDQVAKEKQFDIVLQRGAAVFIDKRFDITQEVIVKLEKAKS